MLRSVYLDRMVTKFTPGVTTSYSGGVATWTLPYSIAVDGSEGTLILVRADTFELLATTRPAPNQISFADPTRDISVIDVYIGVCFESLYRLSTIYPRVQNAEKSPETRGRLTVGFIGLTLEDSTDVTANVTVDGRATRSTVFHKTSPTDEKIRVPVMGKNDHTTIELLTSTYGPFNVSEIVWEGDLIIAGRETQRA